MKKDLFIADDNDLRKLFSERTAATKIIMKRCSGKDISVDLTFKQNFVENGVSCKSAVIDNTDSEYQFTAPACVKRFHCGLMLNQSLAHAGDRVCFEILADDKVVGKYETGYEGGKIEVDVPLHGVNQFVIRSRSLSKNAQVAFYWLDPEITTMQGDIQSLDAKSPIHREVEPAINGKSFRFDVGGLHH